MNNNELGLKIKQLRSQYSLKIGKKFLQKDLAEAVGISRGYIGDIESGRTKPNTELLTKIVNALDGDIWDVIDNGYNPEITIPESIIKDQEQHYESVTKQLKGDDPIKFWVKDTDLKVILEDVIDFNKDLRKLRNAISELSNNEISIFTNSEGTVENFFSLKDKYYNVHKKALIDKLFSVLNFEYETIISHISNHKNSMPIAAHNDDNSVEQQRLMREDLDEL